MILAALPVLIVGALAALTLPFLPSGGWSKGVAVDNGVMDMWLQFKTDPPSPASGPVTLMARLKDQSGLTMRLNEVRFIYSAAGQQFTQSRQGIQVGKFGFQGEGFYAADTELLLPGEWPVRVPVLHGGGQFNADFPLMVEATK